jgi:hypothetical protein
MSIKAGLYRAQFSTPGKGGTGVVYLNDGKIFGGDSALAYVGTYTENSSGIRAQVGTNRHSPGVPSVFGADHVTIELTGHASNGVIVLKGSAPQAPSLTFDAQLNFLAD